MAVDTWALINNRMRDMKGFYEQVDRARKRLKMEQFVLKDYDNQAIDAAINITENKSASYVNRIVAGLYSTKWQTVVEGDISSRNAYKVEQIIEKNLEQADEYLMKYYGTAGIDAWICNHVCHTSLIGIEWMSYLDSENIYHIHALPTDMRWTPFVLNKWASPITYRSKDDLEVELEEYAKTAEMNELMEYGAPDKKLKNTSNEVRDYWDYEKNELWVNRELIFRQPNPYGKLPFVFVWTPSGFMFRDKDYLEYESPGLLYFNDGLYDQLSRQLSIDATLGFDPVIPAYEYESKNPSGKVSRPVPKPGESLEVPEGERHQVVPRPDVNNAALASRSDITQLINEAGPIAPRAYTQPPSAVEVATEVELLDELQNSRFIALQTFKEQLARLIIDQLLVIDQSKETRMTAGRTGRTMEFKVSDLKDPNKYYISYKSMKQNKRLAIVNEARALAMWGKAPRKYILRDILSVEDPDGWEREMEMDRAKDANPALVLAEMAIRYAEEAEDMEDGVDKDLKNEQSKMLVHQYVTQMRQQIQPQAQPEQESMTQLREATEEKGNPNALINLTGRGSGVSTPVGGQTVGKLE